MNSEVGIVLANAPRLERAFGRKLAAVITLISLYFARRPVRHGWPIHFVSLCLGVGLQVWLKFRG